MYPLPLSFNPSQLPGFLDYASTYSEFRILKAVCKVHIAHEGEDAGNSPLSNLPYTYLRVASRPFVESAAVAAGGQGGNPIGIANILAARRLSINDLRQSRWQRQYYPSDIKNSVTFKFYPYTLEWCGKPVGNYEQVDPSVSGISYLRYRSGRRWMPMSFLGTTPSSPVSTDDVAFLGPYFQRLISTEPDPGANTLQEFTPVCNLSIWVQFRGQK